MERYERVALELRVQNRVGYIQNVGELSDEVLKSLMQPNSDLSVLDRKLSPDELEPPRDDRPFAEKLFGFRLDMFGVRLF